MIIGKNIILRTIQESDLEEWFKLSSEFSEIGEYWPIKLPNFQKGKKEFQENGFWEEHSGRLMITDLNGALLGSIGFFKGFQYFEGYEIGGSIFKGENRRKGYMSEALKIFTAYMFELKPIPRMMAGYLSGNDGTRTVIERAGFKHEGTLRKAVFHRGEYLDDEMYSILREECPSLKDVLAEIKG